MHWCVTPSRTSRPWQNTQLYRSFKFCVRPETHMSADIWSSRLFVSGQGGHVCFRFRPRHGQIYNTLCGYAYCPYRMSQNVPMILRPLSSILFIVGQRRRIMFGLTQEEVEEMMICLIIRRKRRRRRNKRQLWIHPLMSDTIIIWYLALEMIIKSFLIIFGCPHCEAR